MDSGLPSARCIQNACCEQDHFTLAEHPWQVGHNALIGVLRRPVHSMGSIDRSDLVIQAFDSGPEP